MFNRYINGNFSKIAFVCLDVKYLSGIKCEGIVTLESL